MHCLHKYKKNMLIPSLVVDTNDGQSSLVNICAPYAHVAAYSVGGIGVGSLWHVSVAQTAEQQKHIIFHCIFLVSSSSS